MQFEFPSKLCSTISFVAYIEKGKAVGIAFDLFTLNIIFSFEISQIDDWLSNGHSVNNEFYLCDRNHNVFILS